MPSRGRPVQEKQRRPAEPARVPGQLARPERTRQVPDRKRAEQRVLPGRRWPEREPRACSPAVRQALSRRRAQERHRHRSRGQVPSARPGSVRPVSSPRPEQAQAGPGWPARPGPERVGREAAASHGPGARERVSRPAPAGPARARTDRGAACASTAAASPRPVPAWESRAVPPDGPERSGREAPPGRLTGPGRPIRGWAAPSAPAPRRARARPPSRGRRRWNVRSCAIQAPRNKPTPGWSQAIHHPHSFAASGSNVEVAFPRGESCSPRRSGAAVTRAGRAGIAPSGRCSRPARHGRWHWHRSRGDDRGRRWCQSGRNARRRVPSPCAP